MNVRRRRLVDPFSGLIHSKKRRQTIRFLKGLRFILEKALRSAAVAFAMYSVIPMPRFEWDSDDMRYHLIFFPWVGAVIGLLEWVWLKLCGIGPVQIPTTAAAAVGTAIPLLVTGGFHMDGYLDTMDALHSHQSREKKLEILKDPHVGAFAVIRGFIYILLYLAAFAVMRRGNTFTAFCGSYFLSRTMSGLSVLSLPSARKDGMLHTESVRSDQKMVKRLLWIELILCAVWILCRSPKCGALLLAAGVYCFFWMRHISRKEFGGLTGDLAGWFVTLTELVLLMAAAAAQILL